MSPVGCRSTCTLMCIFSKILTFSPTLSSVKHCELIIELITLFGTLSIHPWNRTLTVTYLSIFGKNFTPWFWTKVSTQQHFALSSLDFSRALWKKSQLIGRDEFIITVYSNYISETQGHAVYCYQQRCRYHYIYTASVV